MSYIWKISHQIVSCTQKIIPHLKYKKNYLVELNSWENCYKVQTVVIEWKLSFRVQRMSSAKWLSFWSMVKSDVIERLIHWKSLETWTSLWVFQQTWFSNSQKTLHGNIQVLPMIRVIYVRLDITAHSYCYSNKGLDEKRIRLGAQIFHFPKP